ncbi:hypothetical protein [Proteus sp. ZN5]|uniref:hypothetical protein n=1 Tax=Proteus sp. ZN5 TaxID=2697019 RepID=UPI0013E184AC|nr:hypothetical protein [Proteus sp. ZN5]QIG07081.1 hypothetical protein GTK47_17840 [Proteus sp. ZN5]
MYINNIVRVTFSAIRNIENRGSKINNILNGVILSYYNTIISFIKPNSNIKNNFIGLKSSISNIENNHNKSESTTIKLENKEKVSKSEINEVFDRPLSEAKRKAKSDEIKKSVINDIISGLEEIPTLEKEKITEFKKKLEFYSKSILFSGDENSLKKAKDNLLNSIVDTLLNSDDNIKSKFGNVESYKYFLENSINNAIENILYKN